MLEVGISIQGTEEHTALSKIECGIIAQTAGAEGFTYKPLDGTGVCGLFTVSGRRAKIGGSAGVQVFMVNNVCKLG